MATGRNGMTCCLFHEDRHPSMKLNERYFYCFGCGAHGDVIDLTARLLGTSTKDTIDILLNDYHLDPRDCPTKPMTPRRTMIRNLREEEETPHLHLTFVPITEDGRLCAKEIIGNRRDLTKWQDEFWEHMVKKYPELERGESASETGREHIPPRVFKQATNLNKQWQYISGLLGDINAFNAKKISEELDAALRKFFPALGRFLAETKKYDKAIRILKADDEELQAEMKEAKAESYHKLLANAQLRADYENLQRAMDRIPPEIVLAYSGQKPYKDRGQEL